MKYGIYYAYWAKEWGADYKPYVEKVKRLGFDILEISCAGLKDMAESEIKALKATADACGITLTGGYGPRPSESLCSADPDVVANGFAFWRGTFRVLEQLGIDTVGGGLYAYWPADYTKPLDKAGDWGRAVENMAKLGDIAAEYGITTLGMETLNRHEGYLLNVCKEAVAFCKAVNRKNVKIHLDTYHMLLEEDNLPEAVRLAGPLLGHFHVGENNRRLPGQGHVIDWPALGEALRDIGYTGSVVMEPFVMSGGTVGQDIRVWRNLLDDVSEERLDRDAAESVRFLRNAFEG
ncbi:MAG: sugar phosphate isomerase/epimerase [Synergistaceae bacterium]|nr:sugar phosphate isomerase/epimerase [Synergistaceae bacterium]